MASTSSTSPASRCSPGCKEAGFTLFTLTFWPGPPLPHSPPPSRHVHALFELYLLARTLGVQESVVPFPVSSLPGKPWRGYGEGERRAEGLGCSRSRARGWGTGSREVQGRGGAVSPARGTRRTFRTAVMSAFSSLSKGQTSKEGWKSCSLSRHLVEEPQLTGSCPTWSPAPPVPAAAPTSAAAPGDVWLCCWWQGSSPGAGAAAAARTRRRQRSCRPGSPPGGTGPFRELIPQVLPRPASQQSFALRSSLQPH